MFCERKEAPSTGEIANSAHQETARLYRSRFSHKDTVPMLSIVWLVRFKNCRFDFEQLLAQAKAINNLAVPIRVTPVEIVQQPPALVDHHDQTSPGRMGFNVRLEMRRQV